MGLLSLAKLDYIDDLSDFYFAAKSNTLTYEIVVDLEYRRSLSKWNFNIFIISYWINEWSCLAPA